MKKLDKVLDYYETGAFVILLSLMTAVVFMQVVCRYILKSSLPWSEEFSRYCMVYTAFIGVGAGLKAGTHTGVDALVAVLRGRVQWVVICLEKLLCIFFSAVFFALSVQVVIQLLETGQKSATLFLPIAFAYMAMPLGFLGGIIRSIQNFALHLKVSGKGGK